MAFKINKRVMNMAYGLGAAVVIIGALMKIIHKDLGPLTGSTLLTIGLVTEALIFALSAFDTPDEELDWSIVYPELKDSSAQGGNDRHESPEGVLTKKLDQLLKEAKIDADLMASLGASIKSIEATAKTISPTTDSINSAQKYSEEMSLAASQMESINSLYKIQLESANRQAEINQESIENATKLKEQMESLASNLSSLNGVYGGMLSAMNNR